MKLNLSPRDIRLDALRGLLLVIMAAVHVPTPLSHALQEPFGYTSVAEGFIFLSACLSGLVYGNLLRQSSWPSMARRVWERTRLIYLVHQGLLIPTALAAWAMARRVTPLMNHFHDFLQHPWSSLALMPLLLHQPPLFDILPMYVILLGVTPWLLVLAGRHGWCGLLAVSGFGWLVAQGDFGWFHSHLSAGTGPLRLGSFNLLAWQFLWVVGLALGDTVHRWPPRWRERSRGIGAVAALLVGVGLLARHGLWPQAWFNPAIYLWMDKWTMGPLRLVNFTAWVVLLLVWNPKLPQAWLAPVALLGRHSLAVFAFHLPLAIAASTMIQLFFFSNAARSWIGVMVVAALFPWAAWLEHLRWRAINRPVPTPAEQTGRAVGQGALAFPNAPLELPSGI